MIASLISDCLIFFFKVEPGIKISKRWHFFQV